jgi:hypothetical protein
MTANYPPSLVADFGSVHFWDAVGLLEHRGSERGKNKISRVLLLVLTTEGEADAGSLMLAHHDQFHIPTGSPNNECERSDAFTLSVFAGENRVRTDGFHSMVREKYAHPLFIEGAILKREKEGNQGAADWYRGILSDVYLQIIGGNEKPPFSVLLKNLPILVKVTLTASSRIRAMATGILENPRYDPEGFWIGRAQMILGLLYKAKKKGATSIDPYQLFPYVTMAAKHLTEAKRILSKFGQTPTLARVDAALTELGR